MKQKLLLTLFLLTSSLGLFAGCKQNNPKESTQISSDTAKNPVEIVGTISSSDINENIMEESEIDSELGADEPYPIGHTLYDNSITFVNDVAVIMYDELEAYDPGSRQITVTSEADIGNCQYAYVYYSPSPSEFLFQRIIKTEKTDDGKTILTLSGIPLQSEMNREEFVGLIYGFKAYGNESGGEEDAFEQKKSY